MFIHQKCKGCHQKTKAICLLQTAFLLAIHIRSTNINVLVFPIKYS
nr:MAG TPA: cytochrome c-551 [Caudoviricetes sp.]